VDEVVGVSPGSEKPLRFEPFYSYKHGGDRSTHKLFWQASRRTSGWRTDGATEVWLSFTDLTGRAAFPELDAITARLTCFNGDLPSRLPFGSEDGDFQLVGGGPIRRIVTRVKPTTALQPPLGRPQLWRLISQLSLNYLSLTEEGVDALREILRLHNFGEGGAGERQITGLSAVRSEPAYARVAGEHGIGFARGRRVEVDLDEEQFAGGGAFLFAAVLERFLGLYASVNSFSTLVARTRQRRQPMRQWAPRAGWRALL
jgi:type VI secretion system protein ImpG